ncbi:cytochrome P450 6a9-like [Anticarsia gemmatalis]|uniref:cytochrome P450 6a9-like n=1 Tax=Anticarsia gemmatalis TaxID=129554 RepID=UPI003F7684E1
MLFIVLIILCIVLIIVKYKTTNYDYWKKRNILQIDDLLWTFLFNKRSMSEICKDIYDKYEATHIGTSMGSTPALILKDVEDIQAVLAGDFQSFYSRGIQINPNDILADNLLFMGDYRKWKLIRQKLSPVFTSSKLKNMFYLIEKSARDFIELIEDNRHLRKQPFSVLYTYTTASIGAAIFGIDTQTKNTMESPFLDMAWKAVKPSFKTNIQVFLSNAFPSLVNIFNFKVFGEHEDFFVGIVKKVLESRRHDTKRRHDFIEMCLELQKHGIMQDFTTGYELNPTDEVVAAQAFALFIAGADTTANALHFTLLELSNNPKILTKLHKEIDGIFGTFREELSYNDVEKLQYLDMVVSESLRKYPPIGFLQRLCTKDTVLPSKVNVEKDTAVVIPVFAIHRDEKYYPQADVFDPERFSPRNVQSLPKFTYLSFGEGNRVCIGTRFARLQLKAALAWLLRRFTLAEQNYTPTFEKSSFALRDPNAYYELIPRDPVE